MATRTSLTIRNYTLEQIVSLLSMATLKIYTGAQPATPEDASTGTLLLTFSDLYWEASASGGEILLDVVNYSYQATAVATGTAGWGRLEASTYKIDGSVAVSGAQWNISAVDIMVDDLVILNSIVLSLPGE